MYYQSKFVISKMDCPSEENLIRMALQDEGIIRLDFDLEKRTLVVIHSGSIDKIALRLRGLDLGAELLFSEKAGEGMPDNKDEFKQRKVLWIVLIINFAFFIIEMVTGLLSDSMGLTADSLDMLADALVYGMSLWAVGRIASRKKNVAFLSGIIQLLLALLGLYEVVRRFMGEEAIPEFRMMIGIALLALIANAVCLWLLQKTKSSDVHMKASVIFSANDVVINIGVIAAGLLVWLFQSKIPDLVVGVIIFYIVIRGAIRILKLAK